MLQIPKGRTGPAICFYFGRGAAKARPKPPPTISTSATSHAGGWISCSGRSGPITWMGQTRPDALPARNDSTHLGFDLEVFRVQRQPGQVPGAMRRKPHWVSGSAGLRALQLRYPAVPPAVAAQGMARAWCMRLPHHQQCSRLFAHRRKAGPKSMPAVACSDRVTSPFRRI